MTQDKFHVLVDTSVLRQDLRRQKAAFESLDRLARSGRVRVHISSVVEREYESQLLAATNRPYKEAVDRLEKAKRKATKFGIDRQLAKAVELITAIVDEERQYVEGQWRTWKQEGDVVIHPIAGDHGERVMGAYFEGEPPFVKPKSRRDIPDAFVYQLAMDLIKSTGQLAVAVSDGALKEAFGLVDGATIYGSLDELIASEHIQEAIDAQSSHGDRIVRESMQAVIDECDRNKDLIAELIEHDFVNKVAGVPISSPEIPSDDNEASISMVNRPVVVGFEKDEAKYYGDGVIVVPIDCRAVVSAVYYVFKGESYGLADSRSVSLSEYGNEHYFEAEEEIPIDVQGLLSVSIDIQRIPTMREEGRGKPDVVGDLWELAEIELDKVEEISVPEEFPADDLYDGYLPKLEQEVHDGRENEAS